ncbi:hypothetical protein HK098_008264 [Nowakowskiella sp. JEL0407]|nr:hypothetical protein HK098_008264 [Nowakowskiella sp. JEL0407]
MRRQTTETIDKVYVGKVQVNNHPTSNIVDRATENVKQFFAHSTDTQQVTPTGNFKHITQDIKRGIHHVNQDMHEAQHRITEDLKPVFQSGTSAIKQGASKVTSAAQHAGEEFYERVITPPVEAVHDFGYEVYHSVEDLGDSVYHGAEKAADYVTGVGKQIMEGGEAIVDYAEDKVYEAGENLREDVEFVAEKGKQTAKKIYDKTAEYADYAKRQASGVWERTKESIYPGERFVGSLFVPIQNGVGKQVKVYINDVDGFWKTGSASARIQSVGGFSQWATRGGIGDPKLITGFPDFAVTGIFTSIGCLVLLVLGRRVLKNKRRVGRTADTSVFEALQDVYGRAAMPQMQRSPVQIAQETDGPSMTRKIDSEKLEDLQLSVTDYQAFTTFAPFLIALTAVLESFGTSKSFLHLMVFSVIGGMMYTRAKGRRTIHKEATVNQSHSMVEYLPFAAIVLGSGVALYESAGCKAQVF